MSLPREMRGINLVITRGKQPQQSASVASNSATRDGRRHHYLCREGHDKKTVVSQAIVPIFASVTYPDETK